MHRLIAAALLMFASPALAQGGANSNAAIVPDRPPNGRPADARTADGRAVATPAVIAVIAAAKARPQRVMQGIDAVQIRDLLLQDGKLDEAEVDLLDELSAREIRAITVSPTNGKGTAEITGTVGGDAMRVFEAIFEQRYRAHWEAKDPVAGWAALVEEARRSNGSHSRIRQFLARIATEAAQVSTPTNTHEAMRKVLSGFYRRNGEKLPLPVRTLGQRLQYEALVDADINSGGRMPDFFHDLLKQPSKPAAAPAK